MSVSALRHSEPGDQGRLIDIIDRSNRRTNRLIEDLLDHAIIQRSGKLPMNPKPEPVRGLADEVCEIGQVQAGTKTVRVECQIEGNAVVYADRTGFCKL